MTSTMFVLSVFMFACMIQSGFALKCFTCESVSNPKCADLSDKVYQPQECVAESVLSQGSGFFSQLGLGGNSNSNPNKEPLTPTCLKVVTRNGTGTVTARRCAVKYQNQDPCSLTRTASQQIGVHAQFEFCGACETDACNNGNSMKLFYALIVFGAMVSSARLFA